MSLAAGTFVRQTEVESKPQKPLRVLILTKKNSEYGHEVDFKSGLNNSAMFLAEELHDNLNIDTYFTTCTDGNGVDREIHTYKPTHVILEAIWVAPAKLIEIQKLHPKVIFVVRVHSKITFLAYEGNAISWLRQFEEIPNVYVGFNSLETFKDFKNILKENILAWLPNLYKKIDYEKINFFNSIINFFKKPKHHHQQTFNVACFGAIRPMKDILLQAVAAIQYCNSKSLVLRFHINSGRVEQRGDSTLKNLEALFADTRYELVQHGWLNHEQFIEVIKQIDLGMQVSLNESFNVVTADYIYNFKPVVVSHQVFWVADACKCENNIDSIVAGIKRTIDDANLLKENLHLLHNYNQQSLKEWHAFLLNTEL